jgi:hypothetical protein
MRCWQNKGPYVGRTKAPINKPHPLWKGVPIGQSVLVALSYLPLRAIMIFSSASLKERIFSPQGRARPRHTPRPAKERTAPPPTREKAEGLFIIVAAAEAPSHAPTCKLRTAPGHTHPRQPLRFSAYWQHPKSFVLPNNFFRFFVVTEVRCFRALPRWCQHQIVTTAQNAALVVTQTRIPSALPRWCQHSSSRFRLCECERAATTSTPACRHTNPHFTDTSKVVPISVFRPFARNNKTHSRKWKPASHRHFSTPMWQKPAWHRHLLPMLPPS